MDAQILRCPSCGQANKVPSLGTGKKAVCGKCGAELRAAADGHPIVLSDADFARSIDRGKFVVDFWAAWCGPCRMIAPVLDQLAIEYAGKAKVAKIDVDTNIRTPARFQVRSIPAILFFKDGVLVDQVIGAVPKSQLESKFKQHAA